MTDVNKMLLEALEKAVVRRGFTKDEFNEAIDIITMAKGDCKPIKEISDFRGWEAIAKVIGEKSCKM